MTVQLDTLKGTCGILWPTCCTELVSGECRGQHYHGVRAGDGAGVAAAGGHCAAARRRRRSADAHQGERKVLLIATSLLLPLSVAGFSTACMNRHQVQLLVVS